MAYSDSQTCYTSYGEFFFKQGRANDFSLKGCVTLCFAKFKHNASEAVFCNEFMRKSTRYPSPIRRSIHSEEYVMEIVQKLEKNTNSHCVRLELYSSMSPCMNCCKLIQNFISHHPNCEVYIAFTCVYRPAEKEHISALKALNSLFSVKLLDIFTLNEWCLLKERGILHMSNSSLDQMECWDRYWRDVLKKLMLSNKYKDADFSEDIKIDCGTVNSRKKYFLTKVDPEKVKMFEEKRIKITLMQGVLLFIVAAVLFWIWNSRHA